jgi:hypothetical protein
MRAAVLALLLPLASFGAANMVATGRTINASGQWVITFSPCSSPLSPGSGITGITLTNSVDASATTVEAATTSGCTLTVTTYLADAIKHMIAIDDTQSALSNITFTISGGNLTDAGANTVSASGNTGLAPTANNSAFYAAGGTLIQSFWRMQASPALGRQNGMADAEWVSPDGCAEANITWTGSTGAVNINAINYGEVWVLLEDGVQVGSTFTGANPTYSTNTPSATLSGTHEYEICNIRTTNSSQNSTYNWLNAVSITNGTFNTLPAKKKWFYTFGASESFCSGITDTRTCAWWLMARTLGYADQHFGIAGWPITINTFGTIHYASNNLRDCSAKSLCAAANLTFTDKPAYVIAIPGGNDAIVATLVGPDYTTAGYVSGDAVTMLGNLITNVAPVGNKMFVFDEAYLPGIGGTPCPASALQQPYETAFIGAGNAYAALNPSFPISPRSTFAATCGFGVGDFQGDQLHLNATGQQAWANVMLPFLAGFVSQPSVFAVGPL